MTIKDKMAETVAKMPADAAASVLLIKHLDGSLAVASPSMPAGLMLGMIGEAAVALGKQTGNILVGLLGRALVSIADSAKAVTAPADIPPAA